MSSFIPINLGGGTMVAAGLDKAFTNKTYVNEAGDTMRGTLNMGVHRLIVTEPVHPNDAVSMSFLENSITKNINVVNSKLRDFEKELRANAKTIWESINIKIDEKIKKETDAQNEIILFLTKTVNENKKMEKEISFLNDNLKNEIKIRNENTIKAQTEKECAELIKKKNKESADEAIRVLTGNVAVLEKEIRRVYDKEKAEIVEKKNKELMMEQIKNEIKKEINSLNKDMTNLKQELKSLNKKNPK